MILKITAIGTGKIWYRKIPENLVTVPENSQEFSTLGGTGIGTRKKYWHRLLKKLVPEKITGTGIRKNSGYRHTLQDKDNDGGDSGTSYL